MYHYLYLCLFVWSHDVQCEASRPVSPRWAMFAQNSTFSDLLGFAHWNLFICIVNKKDTVHGRACEIHLYFLWTTVGQEMFWVITKIKGGYFRFAARMFGADTLTFPGMFLERSASLTLRKRSFSLGDASLDFIKFKTAVRAALPFFWVPGVSFTLCL